jgi:protocatechuate 3,4-dioxygenase beta subunit
MNTIDFQQAVAHADHDHPDGGLQQDLQRFAAQGGRRRALQWLAGGGALAAASLSHASSTRLAAAAAAAAAACSLIPEETAGPFPGDGSNGTPAGVANALMLSGIVRRDIRNSVGGASGVADGAPLRLQINLVNTNGGCASLAGFAVYLWHCTADGKYSMYSSGVTAENYLRGVQVSDSNGQLVFDTVVPGCYAGRMPHMHFEVYRSLTTATSFSNKLRTSQIAFPTAAIRAIYEVRRQYAQSIIELARMSFATDNVFSDGYATQLADLSGGVSSRLAEAALTVGIAV